MIFLFTNFGEARLSRRVDSVETVLQIPPFDAYRYPQPLTANRRFAAILYDGKQEPEVVWGVTNHLDGTFTVERGKEGSTAKIWNAGTAFVHTLTRDSMEYFITSGQIDWILELQAADQALSDRIDSLYDYVNDQLEDFNGDLVDIELRLGQNYVLIQQQYEMFLDLENAWATYKLGINLQFEDINTSITQLFTSQATFESATTSALLALDTRVGEAESEVDVLYTAMGTLETATASALLALGAQIGDLEAQYTGLVTVQTTEFEALASSINTLSINIGELSGTLTVTAELVGDIEGNLEGRYGVSIGSGGIFASFDLLYGTNPEGETISEFRLRTNQFTIVASTDDDVEEQPFVYDAVTGTLLLENIYVNGAWLLNATIGTAKIADAAITRAKIDNLAVNSAKIANLEVETIKIANAAVTNQADSFSSGPVSVGTSDTLLQSTALTVTGGRLQVKFNFFFNGWHPSGGDADMTVTIKRSGSTIYSRTFKFIGGDFLQGFFPIELIEQPSAGSYIWECYAKVSTLSGMTDHDAISLFGSVTEYKK